MRAVDWWLGELSALIPDKLRMAFAERPADLDCSLYFDGRVACARASGDGVLPDRDLACEPGEALAARLSELARSRRRRTVRLCVPLELCLLRNSRFPAQSLPHVGAILRNEVETLMPLAAGQILADWFVDSEDLETGELHVTQVVLSRSRIRELEDALALAGMRITHLTVGDAQGTPLPVDLVATREPSLRGALARMSVSARLLYAGAFMLLASTPFLAVARQSEALESLGAVSRHSPAVQSAAGVATFIEVGASRVPIVEILDELTRSLSADASIADFHWKDRRAEVTLRGKNLGEARTAVAGSALFKNVEAVAGDLASTDRLRLQFEINARPGPARVGE